MSIFGTFENARQHIESHQKSDDVERGSWLNQLYKNGIHTTILSERDFRLKSLDQYRIK